MILPSDPAGALGQPPPPPNGGRVPAAEGWAAGAGLGNGLGAGLAYAALVATGLDPLRDGVYRVALVVPDGAGWRREDHLVGPSVGDPVRAGALSGRIEAEQGLAPGRLAEAADGGELWNELAPALGGRWTLVPERLPFESWAARLAPDRAPPRALGLDELVALVAPGLGGAEWLAGTVGAPRLSALGAADLPAAALELVRALERFGRVGAGTLALLWQRALFALHQEAPEVGARLGAALEVLDRPSLLARAMATPPGELPEDGWLSAAARAVHTPETGFDVLAPRSSQGAGELFDGPSLPPDAPWVKPLGEADLALVDHIFQVLVPALTGLSERPAQAQVARDVARSLGQRELLLLHAPTGTGKTLAYLVPAILFGLRHRLRVGVATYTRALQTQAMRRDVPLALELLVRAGVFTPGSPDAPRTAVLKGRSAYLCWRAFLAAVPGANEGAARWLAAAHILAFALGSPSGDLDELARPSFGAERLDTEAELDRMLGDVHGDTGCCTSGADRATCAAETARKRAERSHLVLTNQALVLARGDFLAHVVFDECEHLHDQAHAAFSHRFPLAVARQELARLCGSGSGRAPLERLLGQLPIDAPARGLIDTALVGAGEALSAIDALDVSLRRFQRWRAKEMERLGERLGHGLCVEYIRSGEGPDLVAAHGRAARALRQVVVALLQLPSELVGPAAAQARRQLRRLERSRADLEELANALTAWLPSADGAPVHRRETFYDVEELPRGFALVARVLLPPEVLGRYFFPDLAGAVLISATTVLRGSFDAARAYLGLDRAAEPAEDENREPRTVRCARAPESFDYGRVLVAIPSDTPAYAAGKALWLEHVAEFVARLVRRTRGRTLVLFTAAEDCAAVGRMLVPALASSGVDLLWQGMPGESKERLAERFRAGPEAVLLGLDTFWFGADFPGEALEYLVIAKLPYGVPDRYHHAQGAALGPSEQRRRIYLPRALARFRQGFGRLMRRGTDRGCVFVLDGRARESRHRMFLAELPVGEGGARLELGATEQCLAAAFEHMGLEGKDGREPDDFPAESTS